MKLVVITSVLALTGCHQIAAPASGGFYEVNTLTGTVKLCEVGGNHALYTVHCQEFDK